MESSEGYPGLVLAKQRPQAGWTDPTRLLCVRVDRLRQKAKAVPCVLLCCLLARVGDERSDMDIPSQNIPVVKIWYSALPVISLQSL